MTCGGCGRDIQDAVRFCPYCGSEVAPLPPTPPVTPQIPSSEEAAAEDRRMALITAGVVVGAAVLLTALALALMVILSREKPETKTSITLVPVGEVSEGAMAKSEGIIGQRLIAMGIDDYEIHSYSDKLVVELPEIKDIDRVKRIVGSTAQLQFRQVLEIIIAGDPAYDTTEVAQIDFSNEEAYHALEDQEIVLEKEEGGNVYKVRLGPTLLTGDIIDSATADVASGSSKWQIDFSLTNAATSQFADLTTELRDQSEPKNQLAIVLDYEIKSYPRVNEAITGGKAQITGSFTEEEAQDLALILRLGALPVAFTMPVFEVIGE